MKYTIDNITGICQTSQRSMESVWVLCTLALTLSWAKVSVTVQGAEQLHEIPDHAQYAASGTSYDDGGMGPMFDFARSFINTALPGGFPRDFINGKCK